jgi:hypothetical protein
VGRLLADPGRYRFLWEPEWARVEADLALLEAGEATIEDVPETGVALVRAPRGLHPMAVNPRTPRMRVLSVTPDGTLVLGHRYETWVDHPAREATPRVDLGPLARRLDALEVNRGHWVFEGVEAILPRLFLAGPDGRPAPSSIAPARLLAELAATT